MELTEEIAVEQGNSRGACVPWLSSVYQSTEAVVGLQGGVRLLPHSDLNSSE